MPCRSAICNFPEQYLKDVLHFGRMGLEYTPAALPVSGQAGQLSIPSSQDEEIQLFLANAKKTTYLFIHSVKGKVLDIQDLQFNVS